jgi:molecular chaperone GrpE
MADQETSKNVNPEDDDLIREAEACACEKEEPCQNNDTCQNNDACANESATEPTLEKEEKSKKDSSEPSVSETEVLKAALSASNDRYLRLMAEFDNYRRRTTKEQLEIIETANAKLLEKLSEVLDNFERASLPENRGCDIEAFAKGMSMIHDQFEKTLRDAGLEQINPVGELFDPSCQEALLKQPSNDVEENHVIQVFQKGYRLKHKIIKTAKVIVSAGK